MTKICFWFHLFDKSPCEVWRQKAPEFVTAECDPGSDQTTMKRDGKGLDERALEWAQPKMSLKSRLRQENAGHQMMAAKAAG